MISNRSVNVQRQTAFQQPKFQGEKEYQEYLSMLRQFDDNSMARVAHIKRNEKNEGIKHIALAVGYGLLDSNIRKLNKIIVALIKTRKKTKETDTPAYNKAVEFLNDLRNAISKALTEKGYDEKGNKLS